MTRGRRREQFAHSAKRGNISEVRAVFVFYVFLIAGGIGAALIMGLAGR
jgi:hypothetical protein